MIKLRLPDFGRSYAVLIGTGSYSSDKLDDIPGALRNIEGVRDFIADTSLSGFPESHIETVPDPGRAEEIMAPISDFGSKTRDVLLVYYSGHGLLMGKNSDLHVCLTGSRSQAPWSALPFSYLADEIRQSGAKMKILIIDCCYSGRARSYLMADEMRMVEDQLSAEGLYVMASSSATKRSSALSDTGYTAFTSELIQVARNGVESGSELLSMSTLFEEVRRRMRRTPQPLPEQCNTNNAAEMALVRNSAYSPGSVRGSVVTPLDFSRSRAVVVGVGHYDNERLPDIPQCASDARAVSELLVDESIFGFSPENCHTLVDPNNPRDYGRALAEAAEGAEDLLLLYYSGPGAMYMDRDNGHLNLATAEGDFRDPLASLSFRDVVSIIRNTRAANTVVILDTSHSGRVSYSMAEFPGASYIITACGARELAPVDPLDEFTHFTGALLRFLRKGFPGAPIHLSPLDVFRGLLTSEISGSERGPRPQLTIFNSRNIPCLLRNQAAEIDGSPHYCGIDI